MVEQLLIDVRNLVSEHLTLTLNKYRQDFAYVGSEVADLFEVAGPLLDRGKRLRAGFLAAGWRTFGGEALHPAELGAGAGLELFQLAALVHDDLMDSSPTRRGLPAAHLQFAALHDQREMIANRQTFGNAGALLLGDLLLVAAESQLQAAIELAPEASTQAREIFEEMMAEVTVGQYLDIYAQSAPWSTDPAIDVERAHRVIRAKSARYSVEHPLAIGAAMAGATPEQIQLIRTVGLPVGEAFQLRDDVLSVFGDPSITGKPAGDDLREGKRTVLVTLAIASASESEVEFIRSNLGNPLLTESQVNDIRTILRTSGALAQVENLIKERAEAAQLAIKALNPDPRSEELLVLLSNAAISRSY